MYKRYAILGYADAPVYGKGRRIKPGNSVCIGRIRRQSAPSRQEFFSVRQVYVKDWEYPAGAFHGAEGGPC